MSEPDQSRGGVAPDVQAFFFDAARQPVTLQDSTVDTYRLSGYTFGRFQLGDTVLGLLLDTSEFRGRAQSYRDFNVGAGAWAVGPGKFGRTLGYNIKVDKTDLVNIHAEDLADEKAADAGFTDIATLVIIGEPQEDHASGITAEVLAPCGRCRRGRLQESPRISERTLIVMARPDFTVIQFASRAAINAAYEERNPSGITTFRFDETPAILQPRKWEPGSHEPQPVEEIDSTDYDSTIGLYLMNRLLDLRWAA